jgi:hypothetical protein
MTTDKKTTTTTKIKHSKRKCAKHRRAFVHQRDIIVFSLICPLEGISKTDNGFKFVNFCCCALTLQQHNKEKKKKKKKEHKRTNISVE